MYLLDYNLTYFLKYMDINVLEEKLLSYKKSIKGGKYNIKSSQQELAKTQFEIDRDIFHLDMKRAADIAVSRIKQDYPVWRKSKIDIRPVGKFGLDRSLEDQASLEKGGASGTSLSLHNFGAAQDIGLFFTWVDGHGNTREEYYIPGRSGMVSKKGDLDVNLLEYFGGAIRDINELEEKDYFWGWKHDSGHVAMTRFPDQLLAKYGLVSGPKMSEQDLHKWYSSKQDTALAKHKIALETIDSLYNTNVDRVYIGNPGTRDDELLKGITFNRLD